VKHGNVNTIAVNQCQLYEKKIIDYNKRRICWILLLCYTNTISAAVVVVVVVVENLRKVYY